jgi:hypothetical protein
VTSQEKSIFHSNGIPLHFSANAARVRPMALSWMGGFSIYRKAQPVEQGAGAFAGPVLEVPFEPNEWARETPVATKDAVVSAESSSLPPAAGEDFALPSSFSGRVAAHGASLRPSLPTQSSGASRSGQTGPQEQGKKLSPIPARISSALQQRLPNLIWESRPEKEQISAPLSASIRVLKEIGSEEKSGKDAANPDGPQDPYDNIRLVPAEDRGDRHKPPSDSLRTVFAPDEVSMKLRMGVSARMEHPGVVSTQQVRSFRQGGMTLPFSRPKSLPQVLAQGTSRLTAIRNVLEKLNAEAPRSTNAQAEPGRRVHIGKLHITVQRPGGGAVQSPASQPPEAHPAPQPAQQVFFNPWERRYTSFD